MEVSLPQTLFDLGLQVASIASTSLNGMASEALTKAGRVTGARPAGFPPGPAGDAAPALLRDPLGFLDGLKAEFGGCVGLIMGGEYVVVLSDPTLVEEVVIRQAAVYVKEGTAFFPGSSLAGNGLLVSDGAVWSRQRRLSNPSFRRAAVQRYAECMVTSTQRSLRQRGWVDGGVRDLYADYNALTLDITLQALFGASMTGNRGRSVSRAIATAFKFFAERSGSGFAVPEWVPTAVNTQYLAAVAELDVVVYDLIRERRRLHAADPEDAPRDLLEGLLSARDDAGAPMGDREMRDELMTFLVAGQETSAILLGWCSAFLVAHPGVQAAAAAEVRRVVGGRLPCFADVQQLHYLEAVVNETMRLRPPAYMIGRCAREAVTLGGYPLAAGTTVLVAPWLMHRDEAAWPSAAAFDPERWLRLREQGEHGMALMTGLGPGRSYLPFGGGPRNCIGTGLAMTEAVLVLAQLLQRWELQPAPGASDMPVPNPLITLRPASVPVVVRRRQRQSNSEV